MTEQFVIQSDTANMPYVEERIFHFCHLCNVGRYNAAVSTCALQAVENAIVHGNHGNVDKEVTVELGTCRGGLYVEVSDQGDGFDPSAFASLPLDDTTPGVGLFIMNQLSDRLAFFDGGRRVRMEFVVDGIDPSEALARVAIIRQFLSTRLADTSKSDTHSHLLPYPA